LGLDIDFKAKLIVLQVADRILVTSLNGMLAGVRAEHVNDRVLDQIAPRLPKHCVSHYVVHHSSLGVQLSEP
jgi:hypothetical protein